MPVMANAEVDNPDALKANEIKAVANTLFSEGKWAQAAAKYTEAIELFPTAALYSNRAAAYLKTESYGFAIADAETAMSLDPTFIKAYYRRGSAQVALGRFKAAKKDFAYICKVLPNDPDAKKKYIECDKAIKRELFDAAIASEQTAPLYSTIDFESLSIPDDYKGPVLPILPVDDVSTASVRAEYLSLEHCRELTRSCKSLNDELPEDYISPFGMSLAFVKHLMEEQRLQRLLHKKHVWDFLLRARAVFASQPSLVRMQFPENQKCTYINVCGDTHGQYYDLLNIFKLYGFPSPINPYVFNGDMVDRGSFSVENVLLLFSLKLLLPFHFHILRGNHETKQMNKLYGFEGEVKAKYDEKTFQLFLEVFQALPLALTIEKKAFVTHGGLFQQDNVKLDDIERIDRFCEPADSGLMFDMLWSDPQPFRGRGPSKRGVGKNFGPDVTAAFLDQNELEVLIRSHEAKDDGYVVEHDGRCITVFSAPNYCDSLGNKGAVCQVQREPGKKPVFKTFSSVPHPPVKAMAYSSGMASLMGF